MSEPTGDAPGGEAPADAARADDARAVITACPNGPLLVRGDFAIAAQPGANPERPERAVVALCRCGASSIKPLCDGTHKLIGFTTEKSGDVSGGRSEPTSRDRG
ncbi:MAG: CDGSH iron-sulfur domain-containing protein [Corynebacterium sp.]|jgi:CDGSH-type Zn-finger protein|nr:CDGSH iron-sulfur domain-containing protein [Corynebacterium sp.]